MAYYISLTSLSASSIITLTMILLPSAKMLRNLGTPIIAAILLVFLINFADAGNTTCAGNMTQWYTDAVGETACMTYQRLRQICNPNCMSVFIKAKAKIKYETIDFIR
ncbi:hypothetical protein EDB19DRAFT_1683667 [Suillus lakei]|nr:hypothetical protein EDB19DRAFT_1683667 [Suillus lakei]